MKLREKRVKGWAFASLLVFVVAAGVLVAYFSFRAGQNWRYLGFAALLGELLIAYGLFIEPRHLTVVRYREPLNSHPSVWVRILFLSDLHSGGNYPDKWWEKIALETQALAPDIIILGGDYVVDLVDSMVDLKPLAKLRAPLGKYFVLGNHDFLDQPQEIRKILRGYGYEDLTHRSILLKHQSREFEIRGLDDLWYGTIRTFQRRSPQIPHVLVSHEPDIMMDLKAGDTDLALLGHTHGGQVRFPIFGALWLPTRLGKSVYRGRSVLNGVTAIVSNGLGQTKTHPRFFSPPQIVVVEVGI